MILTIFWGWSPSLNFMGAQDKLLVAPRYNRPATHYRLLLETNSGVLPTMAIIVGTAGWSVPRIAADEFPSEGSALQRYASRFAAVEINSSFHRSHRPGTWERWATDTPDDFRFSVKLPKTITHLHKLAACEELMRSFGDEVALLGSKLAVILVQLPPSLAFDPSLVPTFFEMAKQTFSSAIACEPRHSSWFSAEVDDRLSDLGVARVAADPALVPEAGLAGGWRGLTYFRLHGSPVRYRSSYDDVRLQFYTDQLREAPGGDSWCIFDNTASSAAVPNALALQAKLGLAGKISRNP